MNYRDEVKDVLDALVLDMPGVVGGKAFGYPAYKIRGKVFAFVGGDGIALKLPKTRVADLIATDDPAFGPFQPVEGTTWREWVSIDRDDAEAYRDDVALLEESAQFVTEQA